MVDLAADLDQREPIWIGVTPCLADVVLMRRDCLWSNNVAGQGVVKDRVANCGGELQQGRILLVVDATNYDQCLRRPFC